MYLIFNGQRTIYLKGTTNGNKITRVTQVTLKKKVKSFNPCPMGSECHNLNCELYGHICNAFSFSRKTVKVQKKNSNFIPSC